MLGVYLSKRFIGIGILVAAILLSATLVLQAQAQSSNRNSSISFKKESSGFFTVTIKDSQGIKEFSLKSPVKFPYGSEIKNCPTTKKLDNVTFDDPGDFTPFMEGLVVDCQDNRDEFHIAPPKDGLTSGTRFTTEIEEAAPAPAPVTPTPPAPAEEEEAEKVSSEEKPEIKYPVAELGNCKNETDCRSYCENPKNIKACLDFAEKNNILSEKEIKTARKFAGTGFKGPGGCNSKDSCEKYCDDIDNIDACVAFAEQNDMMPPDELEEAKKVKAALAQGLKTPGNCKSKKECDSYCNQPENMEACINFGEAAGFIPPDELGDAKKVLAAIKKGVKPPPCRGKKACDSYCGEPDNFESCITFAEAAGMISADELGQAKKVMEAIKKGAKPPPCRGKDECDDYCSQPENFEGCLDFAAAAGFMSEKDLEMARKTGGKRPGNCRGKEDCEAFCEEPDNQETCFNFAKEHGLIPEEDLQQMEGGKAQMQEALSSAPDEVLDCLIEKLGAEMVEKLKAGTGMPSRNMEGVMKECFEGMMGPGGPGEEGMGPPGGFSGPGGCSSPEECTKFCKENPEECEGFGPPGGGGGMPGSGPPQGMPEQRGGPPPGFEGGGRPSESDIQEMIKKETIRQTQEKTKSFNRPEEFLNREEMMNRPQENPVDKLRQYKEGLDRQFFEGNMPPSSGQQFGPPAGFEQQSGGSFQPPMQQSPPMQFAPPTNFQYPPMQ